MANYTLQTMPYASNATITTELSSCDQIVNLTQTIQDLYNFYRNNGSNLVSNEFSNISIINFDCMIPSGKYFQQIITFTTAVSIEIQIAFASVYYDFISTNAYLLNGFHIDQEGLFTLSSITFNNKISSDGVFSNKSSGCIGAQSEACSSAVAAQVPLCLLNSTTPNCITTFSNPWIFNCSENASTSTISSLFTTNDNALLSMTTSSVLKSWQIGLICGLSRCFILIDCSSFCWLFLRRHSRSKRVTFSCENLFDNMKSSPNNGIPQGQAFQHTVTTTQPEQIPNTTIPSIDNEIYITRKSPGLYNRGPFIDHAKVHDPVFPSDLSQKSIEPTCIPNNSLNTIIPKVYQTTIISRPVSGNQLQAITEGLAEDTLDESDSISLDRSNSLTPKKPSTPISTQFANLSSLDESLHEEDAWMSILDVANAELDVLNRLENEQNSIKTSM